MGMDLFGFSGGGAFNKSSASTTNATTKHTGTNFSEVANANSVTIDGAGAKTINMIDGGAIDAAFKFASWHDARAMDVLDRLVEAGGSMYEAAASQTDQASNNQKLVLYVAGAFVLVFALQVFKK